MPTQPSGSILPAELTDGRELVAKGRSLGAKVTMGTSLLCRTHAVHSEFDYKRQMRAQGRQMTGMNLGMQTWDETAQALRSIHRETEQRGFRIDRFNMNADRRMGLPPSLWHRVAKETGPILETAHDWCALSETVPIQPGLGDMMIGTPMSVSNACNAIQAGVNHIGNMSQFHWNYPGWPGTDVEQMSEMVTALGVMAVHADRHANVSSYLDDGFCAQFEDYCSYVGWSLFERRIVEELVGARLSVSYGGLTRSPIAKAAMILALEATQSEGTFNSAYYGNTTAYTRDVASNHAVLVTDILFIMLAIQRCGSAAAVVPTPTTEALRTPTWQEIVETHAIARRVAEQIPSLMDTIEWTQIEALSEQMHRGGHRFFENILNGFDEIGIDTNDPLQLLLSARRLGAREIERRYTAGDVPRNTIDALQPVIPTDTFCDLGKERERIRTRFKGRATPQTQHIKPLVGSTDVHEYALNLLVEALETLDIEPIVAGVDVDPDRFAELAKEHEATVVLISTHNGMALDYASRLKEEFHARNIALPIIMGGQLNQDHPDAPAPIDVSDDLARLGVHVCDDLDGLLAALRIGN